MTCTDSFQFLEQSTIKSIELISVAGITTLADLRSSATTVTAAMMQEFLLRMLNGSTTVLTDVLKTKVAISTQ